MDGSLRRVFSRRFTIFTDGASPSSRLKLHRPIGTGCSRPRRSELSFGREKSGVVVGSAQRGQHIRTDESDSLVAAIESLGIELRVFADHEILRDMASAVDDDVVEPSA